MKETWRMGSGRAKECSTSKMATIIKANGNKTKCMAKAIYMPKMPLLSIRASGPTNSSMEKDV